jgi:hypothetical protein
VPTSPAESAHLHPGPAESAHLHPGVPAESAHLHPDPAESAHLHPGPAESAHLHRLVERVPEGWSSVTYDGRAYGLNRTSRAGGRSVAVYAEELGGTDVVSTNVYRTSTGDLLKPCEMPASKVLDFLAGWSPATGSVR